MKLKLLNTSAGRITKVYAALLLGITLILCAVIMTVVGFRQFQVQRQQTRGIVGGLERSFIANRNDWYWWRLGSPMDTKKSFVRIKVQPSDKKTRYLYSPHAKRFVSQNQLSKTTVITKNVAYSNKLGLYYHASASDASASAQTPNVRYDVWTKLSGVTGLLWLLFRLIIFIVLGFLILGTWLIYLLARKLNQPLVALTKATKSINDDIYNQYQKQLPVPKTPQEVHDLSQGFNQLLQSLNARARADRQFVSNASHELKTPIATIRGHISLIRRRGEQHPEIIPTSLGFIDQESERMQRLVESLLKLSHANQLELSPEAVNLSQLIEDISQRYAAALPQQLITHVQRDVVAWVNFDSVEQIIINLLNNAHKYSASDTVIEIKLEAVGQEVTLSVIDEGNGIPADQKAHIFDRFYRGNNGQTAGGNGLGLSIVKQLVDVNHGTINVMDHSPQGTIFEVTLPRKVAGPE